MGRFTTLFASLLVVAAWSSPAQAGTDTQRELPKIRMDVAADAPGIERAGSTLVGHRFANLKRGQRIDFFSDGVGADYTLRVLFPSGKAWFDARPIAEGTNPSNREFSYGFSVEAPTKGRYTIQFIASAKHRVRITSNGYLTNPPATTLPGTWRIDYEAYAFDMLNAENAPLSDLVKTAKRAAASFSMEMRFDRNGTWKGILRSGTRKLVTSGTWVRTGATVAVVTQTRNGKKLEQEAREQVSIEDWQLKMSRDETGLPVDLYLDKSA